MPAGLAVQYSTGNAYNSIWGTIVGDYFPAVTTALGTWFVLNSGFYNATHSFLRDAFSFTKIGLYATLPAYAVGAVASALVIAGINLLSPELAHKLPMSFFTGVMNAGVSELVFLTAIGNMAPKIIEEQIAPGYEGYLQDNFGPTSPQPLDV